MSNLQGGSFTSPIDRHGRPRDGTDWGRVVDPETTILIHCLHHHWVTSDKMDWESAIKLEEGLKGFPWFDLKSIASCYQGRNYLTWANAQAVSQHSNY